MTEIAEEFAADSISVSDLKTHRDEKLRSKRLSSGGASGSTEFSTGGNGGGLIRLSALQEVTLHRSEILANGLEGE